jgi:lipopolysaccharide biosynthesis protein
VVVDDPPARVEAENGKMETVECLVVGAGVIGLAVARALAPVYDRYEYVLLLHSKTSSHAQALQNWRGHLLDNLLGSRKIVESILEIFSNSRQVGIIAAQHFEPIREFLGWGGNFEICKALAARFGVSLKAEQFLDFPSGSMFWARSGALRPFFDAKLGMEDFVSNAGVGKTDGTMAHAVERLFFIAAEKAGFSWVKVAQPHLFKRQDTIKRISDPEELHEFIAKQRRILRGPASRSNSSGPSQIAFSDLSKSKMGAS